MDIHTSANKSRGGPLIQIFAADMAYLGSNPERESQLSVQS